MKITYVRGAKSVAFGTIVHKDTIPDKRRCYDIGFEHELWVFVCEIEKFSQLFKVDALQLFLTKRESLCSFCPECN